jgi:ABC-type enterochelin transport system substrate-binding protein
MPLKLPDPEAGTDEHAGPNGAMAEPDVDAAGWAAADFVVFGADAADELLELQAAAPSASVPAIAATPRNLNFMIFLLSCVGEPLRDAGGREGSK